MNINMMKQQRRFKDLGIEGATARWYDNNTRKSRLTGGSELRLKQNVSS
jgi:hypothetical protein